MRVLVIALLVTWSPPALAEQPLTVSGIGTVEPVGAVDSGRGFLEGPATGPDGLLYYTDIPNHTILTLDTDGNVGKFTTDSHYANGLMFNGAGELVACEMDGQVVAWNVKDKTRRVLAGTYEGARFNAPNDLVIDRQGGIYFTDPRFRAPQPLPQKVQGVYYIAPDGGVTRVVEDLPAPNGVLLSRDEKTLYVFPSDSSSMRAFEVKSPGKLAAAREFCRLPIPGNRGADGATIDADGALYVACGLGLQVVSPQGKLLGVIKVPEQPANVTFRGDTLYTTARSSLYGFKLPRHGYIYPAGAQEDSEE